MTLLRTFQIFKHHEYSHREIFHEGAEHCGKRRKRRSLDVASIVLPDDGQTGSYNYNPVQGNINVPDFPTQSGITEQFAKDQCKSALINSKAGKLCTTTIQGFDVDVKTFIEQCVLDIQVKIYQA